MKKSIYLDYAAATPMHPLVTKAMERYLSDRFHNPSAQYLAGKQVAADLSKAREEVAHWLGARPSEVVFTAGGSEANNLAISGVMQQFAGANIVVSAIEHEAVLAPASQYKVHLAKVQQDGVIDLAALEACIDDKTVLVSVMYANNEIGTIQPLKEISSIVAEVRKARSRSGNKLPIYLHTDACQAAAWLDLHVHKLGVDLMTINAGKIYGPKQCGALFVKTGTKLKPQILGGGQEQGRRSGTENVAGIVGFAKALDLVQSDRHKESARVKALQADFIALLTTATIANVKVNGSLRQRLPNNIHITIPDQDNERLMMQLDEFGIQCAVGSACSASSDLPSHVLKAIGLSDAEAQASLRFSMGVATSQKDVETTVKTLASILRA